MHLSRYLAYWAVQRADKPVLTFEGATLTWAELDRRAEALAAHFQTLGVRSGDRVGCLLPNGLEWCVAVAAALKINAIFVPLNSLFGAFELHQIAADAECSAIVSTPELLRKLPFDFGVTGDGGEVIVAQSGGPSPARRFSEVIAAGGRVPPADYPDGDVAAICYTSGTTGVPKGAMLTHRGIELMSLGYVLGFQWVCDHRMLILAPLAFTGGIVSNLIPLFVLGGFGYLERGLEPQRVLKLLVEEKINILGGVPALWQRIAEAPGFAEADLSALRSAVTGGAPVSPALLESYRAKGVVIRQQYGCTEACGCVASPTPAAALARPEACGFANPSLRVELRDDTGAPVAQGELGEICVKGGQLMTGYWRNPQATAAAFQDGWYRTGDLARLNDHGEIVVLDRKKNMVISGGVNVYPAEVERALATLGDVVDVVVFGVASPTWGEEVVAILHAPAHPDPAAIAHQARELLGAYKTPKRFRLSPTPLPRTASNKIARANLHELWSALEPDAAPTA